MAHCLPKATPRAAGGPATATAEQWSDITTAVAAARAIPGIPRISRAGAPNLHCAHLWATDSSTASPPIDNAERNQASTLLYQSVEVGMNNLKRRLFHNEEGAIGYIVAWFLGVPAIVLFAIFVLRGCN